MPMHDFVKSLRAARSLSQQYVAEYLGCTRQTYIHIESGRREISLTESKKLAELFEVPLEDFVMERSVGKFRIDVEPESRKKHEKQTIRISVPQNKAEKFKEVLLYILEKVGAEPHVGRTVIYKLLYFIDFDYYERYEEQLIGAAYQKNKYGPTPVVFKKFTDEMQRLGELEKVKSTFFKYDMTKYLPLRCAGLEKLTAREIKHIDEVIGRLGNKNAKELSQYSHKDVPWIAASDGEIIDYESVFYRFDETTARTYD